MIYVYMRRRSTHITLISLSIRVSKKEHESQAYRLLKYGSRVYQFRRLVFYHRILRRGSLAHRISLQATSSALICFSRQATSLLQPNAAWTEWDKQQARVRQDHLFQTEEMEVILLPNRHSRIRMVMRDRRYSGHIIHGQQE